MNLFDSIFNKATQQAFGQTGQAIKQSFQPLTDYGTQAVLQNVEAIKPAIQPIKQAVTKMAEPIVKPIQRQNKVNKVNDFIASKGLTVDHIKELARMDGTDPEEAIQSLRSLGIKVQGMEENPMQQPMQQIPQGEDLGFFGGAKELLVGGFRGGEQIPRLAGAGMDYLTQNVTGPLVAGGLDLVGADQMADRYRDATKTSGEAFKRIGNDITMAGMTDGGTNPLTQKQIEMRQMGGELALTAPIGGGYLAGAKGVGGLALRSGVVGAGFGATQPIIDKGGQATVGDIATGGLVGGVTGAVAGPLIGKVIAPAIGGIASKTGKYGKALIKGGVEGAKKSIVRDVNAVKTGIQKGIQNRADIASTNINRMNAGQIRSFNEEIGVSPGKFLNDRGLNETGDDLVENLSKNLKLSRKSADEGLANIKGNFKAPTQEVATATVDDTGKFVTKQVDPVETMLRDNLENASSKGMSKESLRAKQLLEKYQEQGLSMTEINEAKRFLNANNKFSYFSDDVSPRKGFVTNLDNEVRKWQFDTAEQQGFSNLKDINMDTKAYYKLLEGIGGWQDKIAGNNPMGLTDWLAFNADPSVFLAKQVAQSNIAKRGYLKGLNALSGRKVQPEIKKPTNLIKNDIPNSNNSGNVPSSKRINVKKPIITPKKKVVKPNTIKNESKVTEPVVVPKKTVNTPIVKKSVDPNITPKEFGKYKNTEKGVYLNPMMTNIRGEAMSKKMNSGTSLYMYEIRSGLKDSLKRGGHTVNLTDGDIHGVYTLDAFIDHPKLFEKYPTLKNQEVVLADFHTTKKRGVVSNGKIYLNSKIFAKDKNDAYSTLVHEIEHRLQEIKGLNKYGGDFGSITNKTEMEELAIGVQNEFLKSMGMTERPKYSFDNPAPKITTSSNAKQQGIKSKSIVKNPESSQTQANGPRVIGKMGKVETKTSPQSATSYEAGMRRPFTMGANKPLVKRATDIDIGVMDFNKALKDEMSNTKRTPPSKVEYSVTATLKKIKEDLENAKSKKEILDTTLAIDSYIKRGLDSTAYPESVMNIANKLHDMARAKRNTVMEKIDTNGLNNAIKEMEDRLSVYKQKGLQGKMLENYKDQISALKILKSHAESPGDYGLYEITSENTFKKDLSNTLSYMKKRFEDRAFGIDPFIDRQMKQIKEYYTRK